MEDESQNMKVQQIFSGYLLQLLSPSCNYLVPFLLVLIINTPLPIIQLLIAKGKVQSRKKSVNFLTLGSRFSLSELKLQPNFLGIWHNSEQLWKKKYFPLNKIFL